MPEPWQRGDPLRALLSQIMQSVTESKGKGEYRMNTFIAQTFGKSQTMAGYSKLFIQGTQCKKVSATRMAPSQGLA